MPSRMAAASADGAVASAMGGDMAQHRLPFGIGAKPGLHRAERKRARIALRLRLRQKPGAAFGQGGNQIGRAHV